MGPAMGRPRDFSRGRIQELECYYQGFSLSFIPDSLMPSHQLSRPSGMTISFVRVSEISQTDSHGTKVRTTHPGKGSAALIGLA